MGAIENQNKKIFSLSSNIIISMNDENIGDMYIYDDHKGYILNNMTASDLVDYFVCNDNPELSREILDTIMGIEMNKGTH